MDIRCPLCGRSVPEEHVALATDSAWCPHCREMFLLPQEWCGLQEKPLAEPCPLPSSPPAGITQSRTSTGVVITATTRSMVAFILVPFYILWCGFFLMGLMGGGFTRDLGNPLVWMMYVPFLGISLSFGGLVSMLIFGRIRITIDNGIFTVFTGLGPLGRTRTIPWNEVTAVREETVYGRKGSVSYRIALIGPRPLRFGGLLSDSRRSYLIRTLHNLIKEPAVP